MSRYAQTSSWIANAKAIRKKHEDAENTYYMKFIRGNAVPTQKDVDEYGKVLAAMKAAARQMNEDRLEIDRIAESFGGPSDEVVNGAGIMLDTLKKKIQR